MASEDQYNWEVITPTLIWNQYYVIIYTCSASTFVVYAEETNNSSTWWNNNWWSWDSWWTNSWTNWWWNWWWNWGWWGWGWWGWWGWSSNKDNSKTNTWAVINSWVTVDTWTNNTDTSKAEDNNNWTNPTIDTSWYQEWDQNEILSNWYSREFNNAYTFAYKNWITTMDSIDKADMNGWLNRIAMAKMLSSYAMNVLGKKPANIVVPDFPDVSNELNKDYGWAVDLAYQLWIMWIWIDNFRPYDEVTRAEFWTALSRMLFGLADGNPYYSTHLAKLKAEWIISNDNPDLRELRGYVMLMLMRSAM